MRLRLLIALQLLFALVVLSVFIYAAGVAFWSHYAFVLPSTLAIGGKLVPLKEIVLAYVVLLILISMLVFMLIYMIFDRSIIRPVKVVTTEMVTFAQTQSLRPLPKISMSALEIRELVRVFIEFTNSVEKVHERDMEISRVKSDFISTAAHQLRTPLTGIRWALEALSKEPLTEAQHVLVEDAANKSRDLVAIVGTLLDISSIESGKHKYVFEPLQLEDLATVVTNDFNHLSVEKGVTLSLEPPETALPKVRADHQQVKWVLNNLIENAIRYTPSGGTVRVQFKQAPGRVQVLVRDTGIGITSKDRNNIFERFYRAENAIAKENKGNGLGLYISRQIAADHGGDLNFAPNDGGQGTTFTLSLPAIT
jgi:signal transduction histidine kinase